MYEVMANLHDPVPISIDAQGEEVQWYMKTQIVIKYQQKKQWYCVTHGLASALHIVGNCDHIIKELLKLVPSIEGKYFKFQEKIIKNTYNYVF